MSLESKRQCLMKAVALMLTIFSLQSCDLTRIFKDYTSFQRQLDSNRALWEAQHLSDYHFQRKTMASSPNAGRWFEIIVMNSSAVSVHDLLEDTALAPSEFAGFGPISSTFQLVQYAIDSRYESMDVRYDQATSYVTYANLTESSQIADAQVIVENQSLVPIP